MKVGIHHSEVMLEGKDIFGDAVNLAYRIETLGVPDSILFSKKVADEIRNKSKFQVVSMGNFEPASGSFRMYSKWHPPKNKLTVHETIFAFI